MSDSQDQLMLRQRQVQQRQILAMMGINQWVRPESPTMNIANIPLATDSQPTSLELEAAPADWQSAEAMSETHPAIEDYNDVNIMASHLIDAQSPATASAIINSPIIDSPVTATFDQRAFENNAIHHADLASVQSRTFIEPAAPVNDVLAPLVATARVPAIAADILANEPDDSFKKVAPFDLQGGRYGNWVLMVDIQALDNDSQKLWHNITQALSLTCETSSFPICAGMDTAELANASLAGYIFKIGRSEEVLVASLTKLPEGLAHPHLTVVPTLEEMLADSSLKRQLWEQLSSHN